MRHAGAEAPGAGHQHAAIGRAAQRAARRARGHQPLDEDGHRGPGRVEAPLAEVAQRPRGPERRPAGPHRRGEVAGVRDAEERLELAGRAASRRVLQEADERTATGALGGGSASGARVSPRRTTTASRRASGARRRWPSARRRPRPRPRRAAPGTPPPADSTLGDGQPGGEEAREGRRLRAGPAGVAAVRSVSGRSALSSERRIGSSSRRQST